MVRGCMLTKVFSGTENPEMMAPPAGVSLGRPIGLKSLVQYSSLQVRTCVWNDTYTGLHILRPSLITAFKYATFCKADRDMSFSFEKELRISSLRRLNLSGFLTR